MLGQRRGDRRMELRIGEAAARCGVSVRTLRHYDRIGLVRPARRGANYRVYTEAELARLQEALFFRELGFSLSEIAGILSRPDYERREALLRRRALLLEKQRDLAKTLCLLDDVLEGKEMKEDREQRLSYEETRARYRREARARWGTTAEFRAAEERAAARSAAEDEAVQREAEEIFAAFAALGAQGPDSPAAQELAQRWQAHISRNHYPCETAMLASLAEMYVGDERFRQHLDAYGPGTAQRMHDAIMAYCQKEDC